MIVTEYNLPRLIFLLLALLTGCEKEQEDPRFPSSDLISSGSYQGEYWAVDSEGVANGGSGVQLTPRDMARFGYLYLKDGVWDGEQIVSAEWVEISQQKHIKRKYIPDYYYGYHWWVSDKNTYSAMGYGGQCIIIVPEHDLVVVFTNHFTEDNDLQRAAPERLLNTYIIPAIK